MAENWPEAWPNVVGSDELYVFDPNGDVLLQLKRTFVIEASTASEIPPIPQLPEVNERVSIMVTLSPDQNSLNLQRPIYDTVDEALEFKAPLLESEDEQDSDDTLSIYLQVSSRHLILASLVFKTMLGTSTFAEGKAFYSQGHVVVRLSDDPEPLIVLMYILHGMTRRVPRHTSLDFLVKLATLVDYYQLHEAVEPFSYWWVANLKQKAFPKSYGPEVVPWLLITWVFQKRDAFEKVTRILICECDDKSLDAIEHENIPIPPLIHDKIQEHRNEAIRRIIMVVHDYIAKYLAPDIVCSQDGHFACDANVLGSLLKSSAAIGIWPRPEAPFPGMTFNSLATQTREMQVLDDCNQQNKYHIYGGGHGIKKKINASIISLKDQVCFLKLDFFLPGT